MHEQGTASKLQRALKHHAQGHDRFESSMAVVTCVLSRSSAPKGGMVGKNNLSGNDKSSSEIESELTEELSRNFQGSHPIAFPPQGCLEQRGVVTCRTAPCLKLGVRQRKRSFSLGATPFSISLRGS